MNKIIFFLVLSYSLSVFTSEKKNLECKNANKVLVLEKSKDRKEIYYFSSMRYRPQGRYKHREYYGADCFEVEQEKKYFKMKCMLEIRWTVYETVSFVKLAKDKSHVIFQEVVRDRRYSKGYRLEKPIKMKCSKTSTPAGSY